LRRGLGFGLAVGLGLSLLPNPSGIALAAAPVDAAATAPAQPSYAVVDLDAIKKLLHKSRGHVVLVHFWASWCFPCLQELPLINKFAADMKPRGLEVLSLSLDDPAKMGPRVGALLQQVAPNLTPTIAKIDDVDSFIGAFDSRWEGAIPALFAYDRQGQMRRRLIGEASRRELDGLVSELLKTDSSAPRSRSPAAP
jgi:thiol-disulfide isomerase/thioredoxin